MAKKKSNAQIRRAQKRAAARGEEYVPPPQQNPEENDENDDENEEEQQQDLSNNDDENDDLNDNDALDSSNNDRMTNAAMELLQELEEIAQNEELRSKERRSLKRKAEAIAAEKAGCSVEEIQTFCEEHQESLQQRLKQQQKEKQQQKRQKQKDSGDKNKEQQSRHNPYIVFVGQLNYNTTKEGLLDHIRKELGKDGGFTVNSDTVKIRLLTDNKTKKSRGMAFVELSDPEMLYACLKLHHTMLDGRRLNVERSAGGKKNSTNRNEKIKQYRQEQEEYLAQVVDNILKEHQQRGEIQENEFDEGVIALCKRHTASLVETTLTKYIENNGREMDNPSAYFTFLLCKLAEEGIYEDDHNKKKFGRSSNKRPSDQSGEREQSQNDYKKTKTLSSSPAAASTVTSQSSLTGVDFSSSVPSSGDDQKKDLSQIFPSLNRGRGRGRGYM